MKIKSIKELRWWLIEKLALDNTIIINTKINSNKDTCIYTSGDNTRGAFVSNCYIDCDSDDDYCIDLDWNPNEKNSFLTKEQS